MASGPCLNPNCHSHGKSHPNCKCYQPGGEAYADGGSICDYQMPHQVGCEYYKDGGAIAQSHDFGAAMHSAGGVLDAHKGKSPDKHARHIASGHKDIDSKVEDLFSSGHGRPPEHDQSRRDKLDSAVKDGSLSMPPEGDLGNIDPQQSAMMGMARGRTAQYLSNLRPSPESSPRLAFDEPMEDPEKTRMYNSALDVANDPGSVLSHLKAGTYEPEHGRHLGWLHPEAADLYKKKATARVTAAQMAGETPDAHVRAGLSSFLGAPLSGEMTTRAVMAAQAVFAAPVPQQDQAEEGGKKPGGGSKKALSGSDKAYLTPDQARQERDQKT